jgi:hypothetical protein
MINDWQKIDFKKGIEKGHTFIVMKSRQSGKSMFAQHMLTFASSWTEWKPEWTWTPKKSSRSGKMIWGRIMTRSSKYVISGNKLLEQRATPKEALTQQREAFKRALS